MIRTRCVGLCFSFRPDAAQLANPAPFNHNLQNEGDGIMAGIRVGHVRAASLLAAMMIAAIMMAAIVPAQAYTPEQQQACTDDAFRVCGSEIPDVDRVTACMVRNKAQLSPPCRAQFGPDPRETVADTPAGRPLTLRPAAHKKPVKARAHKTKKSATS
jgi:hypothetical protein